LNSDQITWKDRAKDALPVRKKIKFYQAFYKRKRSGTARRAKSRRGVFLKMGESNDIKQKRSG